MSDEAAPFEIATAEHDGRLHLAPSGELDLSTAPELEPLVLDALRAGRHVVLDLRELEFMDSAGLRLVMRTQARAQQDGRRLVIIRGGETIERVFTLTGLDEELEIVDEPFVPES